MKKDISDLTTHDIRMLCEHFENTCTFEGTFEFDEEGNVLEEYKDEYGNFLLRKPNDMPIEMYLYFKIILLEERLRDNFISLVNRR